MAKYLYVIVSRNDETLYKIGITDNLHQRFDSLRTGRMPITVLMMFQPQDANGCERYLHNKFAKLNVHGEWFRFEDRTFMQDVFDCCMNNLVDNSWFFGAGKPGDPEDPEFLKIVDSYYFIGYKFIEKLLNHKYVSPTLPLMMKRVGCVVKNTADGRAYLTPKGIEANISRYGKYKNIPISEIV